MIVLPTQKSRPWLHTQYFLPRQKILIGGLRKLGSVKLQVNNLFGKIKIFTLENVYFQFRLWIQINKAFLPSNHIMRHENSLLIASIRYDTSQIVEYILFPIKTDSSGAVSDLAYRTYLPSLLSEKLNVGSYSQNGCFSSIAAVGLSAASLTRQIKGEEEYVMKHLSRKSFASGDMVSRTSSGIGGAFPSLPSCNVRIIIMHDSP